MVRIPWNKGTKETWLAKVLDKYPENAEKYDYSQVVYKESAVSKVKIRCKKHDWVFETTPGNHMSGKGCAKCSKVYRYNTEDYVQEVLRKYPQNAEKYDYSEVEYTTSLTKIKIICLKHGPFWSSANGHLSQDNGCPDCAPSGFFPSRPAHYYVNKLIKNDEFVAYKAGISDNWERRLKKLREQLVHYGYTVEPVQQKYFESGAEAWDFEQEMLKKTDIRAPVLDIPGGHELFLQNPLEEE